MSLARGVTAVELAMALPVIMLTIGLLIEISLFHYARLASRHALLEAARTGVTLPTFVIGEEGAFEAAIAAVLRAKLPRLVQIDSEGVFTAPFPVEGGLLKAPLTVNGSYQTSFLRLIGVDALPVSVTTEMFYERQPPPQPLAMRLTGGNESSSAKVINDPNTGLPAMYVYDPKSTIVVVSQTADFTAESGTTTSSTDVTPYKALVSLDGDAAL